MKNNKLKSLILISFMSIATLTVAQTEAVTVVEGYTSEYGSRSQDLSKLPKMERDIAILKNVLNDLFNGGRDMFYGSNNNEGIYIPGRGVIFNMSSTSRYGNMLFAETIAVELSGQSDLPVDESEKKSADELNEDRKQDLENKSKQFLLNYGSLLSELKPNEKVMLNIDFTEYQEKPKSQNSRDGVLYVSSSRRSNKRMVSSISYADIDAFMDGKLDESAAESKIDIQVIDKSDNSNRDVQIFAGIMDDLFNTMADGKFKRRGRTSHTYFEGFGLMYNLKFSTGSSRNIVFALVDGTIVDRTDSEDAREKREEESQALEEAFPEFEKQLKQNILEYGRTLRSVKEDEVIIVNVDLGSVSRSSKIPRSLQLIIPKNLINDYAKGNKSLEKAADEIDVKRLSTALSNSATGYISAPAASTIVEPFPVVRGRLANSQGKN